MSFQNFAGNRGNAPVRGGFGSSSSSVTPPLSGGSSIADTEEGRSLAKLQEDVQGFARAVASLDESVRQIGSPRDCHELRQRVRVAVDDAQGRMKDLTGLVKRCSAIDMKSPQSVQRRQRLIEAFVRSSQDLKRVSQLAAEREHTPIPESALRRQQLVQQQRVAMSEEQEKQSLLEAARREQLANVEAEREYVDGVNIETEEEVRQLESSVVQVNEMFRDLASIVQEQGITIDTIDANVTDAVRQTDAGLGEVQKADKYERKTRSKMCIILVAAVITLAVICVLIVVPIIIKHKK